MVFSVVISMAQLDTEQEAVACFLRYLCLLRLSEALLLRRGDFIISGESWTRVGAVLLSCLKASFDECILFHGESNIACLILSCRITIGLPRVRHRCLRVCMVLCFIP